MQGIAGATASAEYADVRGAFSAESPDALVRVVVNAQGQILRVDLDAGIARLDGQELSRLIVATSEEACRRATAHKDDALRQPDTEYSDGLPHWDGTSAAAVEWQEAIGAMETDRHHMP